MVTVIIEREIAPDLIEPYDTLAHGTLDKAIETTGFVQGQSLQDKDNPNHRVIIATWRSFEQWQSWYHSSARREALAEISALLLHEEKITVLEPSR